jgi:hypothetical protein
MRMNGCCRCGGPLVEIVIARGDDDVLMQSCSRCDARWWHENGRPVDLPRILDVVSPRR